MSRRCPHKRGIWTQPQGMVLCGHRGRLKSCSHSLRKFCLPELPEVRKILEASEDVVTAHTLTLDHELPKLLENYTYIVATCTVGGTLSGLATSVRANRQASVILEDPRSYNRHQPGLLIVTASLLAPFAPKARGVRHNTCESCFVNANLT